MSFSYYYYFLFLITMAKIWNDILNKSSDHRHYFLFPGNRGNASRCPSFNVKLILFLLHIIFIVWRLNLLDLICSWLSSGKYVELWTLSQFVEKIKWFLFLFPIVCIIMLVNICFFLWVLICVFLLFLFYSLVWGRLLLTLL